MKKRRRGKLWMAMSLLLGLIMSDIVMVPSVQAATRREVGIATGSTLLWMDDAARDRRLLDIKKLGVKWIRVDFSWSDIQPAPDQYKWELHDRVVAAAHSHNIKILALLSYTPVWARSPDCQVLFSREYEARKCAPRSEAEFAAFAGAVAARYSRHTMRGWELWNEPNLNGYWKSVDGRSVYVDPRMYARLANAAAREIKPHNPDSVILTGGLGPMFEPTPSRGMRQSDYLAAFLPHLEKKLFTGIAVHPYSWPALPRKAAPYNAYYTVDKGRDHLNLRTIMYKANWGDKEIWATEYGASTKGLRRITDLKLNQRLDHVSEKAQARLIGQGVRYWYKKENVGPIFVHGDSDQWLAQRKNERGFGLKRRDGTPKPAYEAFRQEVQRLHQ